MKNILSAQNFWAIVTILVLVLVVPYALCWFWYAPKTARAFIYDPRLISTGLVIGTGLLCKLKIYLREELGFFRGKKTEAFVDIVFLNLPIIVSFGIFCVYLTISALIVTRILYNISINKHADKKEKIQIILTYLFVLLVFAFVKSPTINSIAEFIFFVTTLKIFLYLILNFISSVREDPIFVDRIISGLYWVLAQTTLFIIGSPYKFHGELPEEGGYQAYYSNHGGALPEYAAASVVEKTTPLKPLAGANLLKYPVFGDFVKMLAVVTERPEGNTKHFFPWILNQILNFFVFIAKKFKKDKALRKNRLFAWLLKKTSYEKSIRKNAENILTIAEAVKKGFIIFVFPDGRDRLSKFLQGILKRHKVAVAEFVDSVIPLLFVGSMHYKPASNKEPLAKKMGWRFQRWVSPCTLHIHRYPVMKKRVGETKKEFTDRIDDFLLEKQKELGFTV